MNSRGAPDQGTRRATWAQVLALTLILLGVAAIALPQLENQRRESYDAAAKSDLRNLMTAEEAYRSDHGTPDSAAYADASVPPGGGADLDADGQQDFEASELVSLQAEAFIDGYRITAKHRDSDSTWCVNTSMTEATAPMGRIVAATRC